MVVIIFSSVQILVSGDLDGGAAGIDSWVCQLWDNLSQGEDI